MRYQGRKTAAQSTIEYILLTTFVVIVVITFMRKNGSFARGINSVLKAPSNMTDTVRSQIVF